jgi:hypothetical protein
VSRCALLGSTIALSAVCLLAGCDRPRESSPAPSPQPQTTSAMKADVVEAPNEAPTSPGKPDTSAGKPDDAARDRGRQEADAKGALSKEEESKAMPLAGQVNNHSSSADTATSVPAVPK